MMTLLRCKLDIHHIKETDKFKMAKKQNSNSKMQHVTKPLPPHYPPPVFDMIKSFHSVSNHSIPVNHCNGNNSSI